MGPGFEVFQEFEVDPSEVDEHRRAAADHGLVHAVAMLGPDAMPGDGTIHFVYTTPRLNVIRTWEVYAPADGKAEANGMTLSATRYVLINAALSPREIAMMVVHELVHVHQIASGRSTGPHGSENDDAEADAAKDAYAIRHWPNGVLTP